MMQMPLSTKQQQYSGPIRIEELDASPGIHGVSDVAKGGTPVNQQEQDEMQQHKPGERMGQCSDGCCEPDTHELMEAYAKLFEGLAGVARGGMHNEEEC